MVPFESKKVPVEKRAEFMRLARARYVYALQLDADDRQLSEDDVKFAVALPVKGAGTTQWHAEAAMARIKAKRPCLTENRLPTFTAQVVNDGRQSKPAIKISAMDNGTKETAEFYQGRIRQIEYDCNADVAYDTSREQQVTCGRAFLRVTWAYVPGTFKRQARIEPIQNQFSVVFGPSREYDCSDAEYCFVITLVSKEEHERQHGKDTTAARTDFSAAGNLFSGWLGVGPNGEMVQKAEYWLKEYKLRTLCKLSNGKEYWKDELPDGLPALGITIEETRDEQDVSVVQYIIDGADILDETDIIGPYIGIVPVWGREWFVDGARRTSSLIRYAMVPQQLLNLYVSNIAEQIAQMPKTPYMVPVGGIPAGSQAQWDDLNNTARQYVFYNAIDPITHLQLPAPSRVVQEPPIAALVAGYNQAVDAIKAAMGIYDASLGNNSNEVSGIAINSRKRESDNANFHFHDNEARSRNHIGRILLILIPELDKGKGMRAVRSEAGKTTMVPVGAHFKDQKSGNVIIHDLTSGDYGVAVDTSQSYNSQRQEAADTYGKIANADKNFMTVAGDIFFRSLDAPFSEEIADRYKKMLPAPLQDAPKDGAQPDPARMAAQFKQVQTQAMQMMDQLTAKVHEQAQIIETQQITNQSRERIAELHEQTVREVALATLDQNVGLKVLQADLAAVKHRLDLSQQQEDRQQANAQAELDRQHQAQQGGADRAHQADQAQQDRTHQAAMAATPPPVDPNQPDPNQPDPNQPPPPDAAATPAENQE